MLFVRTLYALLVVAILMTKVTAKTTERKKGMRWRTAIIHRREYSTR